MKAVFKCDFCDETFDNEIEAVEHEKKCSRNPENKITDCTITRLSMILHELNEIIGAVISDLRDDQIDLLKQILKDTLDLINRQKAEIEELKLICDKERADRLYLSQQNKAIIAGQETLQKALAEKNAEIERSTNLCQEQNIEIKRLIETKNRLLYNLKAVCKEKAGEG